MSIIVSSCIKFIASHVPTSNFLSDIAAFETGVIALAIPLSFDIVSRISERYQSEVITKRFIRAWEIKWLPILLIFNIITAVILRFFVDDNPTSGLWKLLAWLTFFVFLIVVVALFSFFILLKKYMTDMEFILRELFDEAEELLK
jgi:hypothetical protein